MSQKKLVFSRAEDPYHFVMRVFFTKWKPYILRGLYVDGVQRFSGLCSRLPISEKVLAENLKELVEDGLVSRTVYAEVPPRVEYTLTERGQSVIPLLKQLYDWGWQEMTERGMPIDRRGQMYHGHLPPDPDWM